MTVTLTKKEAQQVLKVLEYPGPSWPESRTELAVVLRYKLSASEPEPAPTNNGRYLTGYTAPPQREWVGLTDEDIKKMFRQSKQPGAAVCRSQEQIFAQHCRAIEAKLREKNT